MFDKLPDLFGKDFAVGFFLPVALAMMTVAGILDIYGFLNPILQVNTRFRFDALVGTTIFLITAWFGGITLVATNLSLSRLFEGYGKWNPLQFLLWRQRFHYRRLREQRDEIESKLYSHDQSGDVPIALLHKRAEAWRDLVTKYPDQEQFLLPTALGNTIRSLQIYSRVMYGIDAIACWPHLQAVVPASYHSLINEAKAYLNYWLNLGFLALCNVVVYGVLTVRTGQVRYGWIPVALLVVFAISVYRAERSAEQWGELYKASFDLFLPDLAKKLGLELPDSREKEREMWRAFSQAVLYYQDDVLPERECANRSQNTAPTFEDDDARQNNDGTAKDNFSS